MAPKHNNALQKNHFRKYWQRHIRTWFHHPMQVKRRKQRLAEKAAKLAPRPAAGPLRPLVHCPTIRYNSKIRLGRGFSLDELRAVNLNKNYARSIGIAVDHRRRNKSMESLNLNVDRLRKYLSLLILFPKKSSRQLKGDSSAQECAKAVQCLHKEIIPIQESVSVDKDCPMKISEEMKNLKVYRTLRRARYGAWHQGRYDKKARAAEKK
ncbi:hypothetical protein GJ496_007235 [Pomphorhynchus laevis]|nr:hypothetical protein GJ496_007235 [Pomphorhynchus laevis]